MTCFMTLQYHHLPAADNLTLKDVRNHIYTVAVKHKVSKLDQANLDLNNQE